MPERSQVGTREWLVTNGLGGYASGTVSTVMTRRYHGLLIAALPAPLGRMLMLSHLDEQLSLPDGTVAATAPGWEASGTGKPVEVADLAEFRLEMGLPVWRYELGEVAFEKRLLLPYRQNTVHVRYRLVPGSGPVRLQIRPAVHFPPARAARERAAGGALRPHRRGRPLRAARKPGAPAAAASDARPGGHLPRRLRDDPAGPVPRGARAEATRRRAISGAPGTSWSRSGRTVPPPWWPPPSPGKPWTRSIRRPRCGPS